MKDIEKFEADLWAAAVKVLIWNTLYNSLPRPPFTEAETEEIAARVYDYVWQRSASGHDMRAA